MPSPSYSWRFFHRPQETWEAMYLDCRKAAHSIEFEQYIIEDDSVGNRFMELFIEKAKQGVKIFLICDRFGSSMLAKSPLINRLRRHGGHVHFYNLLRGRHIVNPWRWFPRTHTKTLLIDSAIAYTGGVCMSERMKHWRDTHARVTGPVIQQVRRAFDDMENRILRKRSKGIGTAVSDRRFLYFLNRPMQNRLAIYRELMKAVNEAQDYIYIASAYFIPNRRFIAKLRRAHRSGVDVRIIVPATSDVPAADWLCLSYTPLFLKSGLRIFHYNETVLHSKIAMIDDRWATVGSTNFDVISFFHNREANLVITDTDAVADLKRHFIADLEHCTELTWELWRKVPRWKVAAGYSLRLVKGFFG